MTVAGSNVFALVIGINQYPAQDEYSNLQAAVADADAMEAFLERKLNTPHSHIISLRDGQASREEILESFNQLEQLLENTADDPSTAIIIYFAGHGARTRKPTGEQWESWATADDHIELLCPSDIGVPLGSDPPTFVQGIPDRTICSLLNKLSKSRGNNITLILDCCHSAGANRGSDDEHYIPRRIENPPAVSPSCDEALISNFAYRYRSISTTGFSGKFQDSHVLMAACGREQQAYEKNGRGLFTQRLLAALETSEFLTTTYNTLSTKMTMPKWQTPHFEGKNLNRLVFNVKGTRSDPSLIPGHREKSNGGPMYLIDAGSAQGVEPNSQFKIYKHNLLPMGTELEVNPSLGIMVATAVESFSSRLEFLPNNSIKLPARFYAQRDDQYSQPILIWLEDELWLQNLFPGDIQQELGVKLTENKDTAILALTVEGDEVCFDRNDTLAKPYIGSRFTQRVRRNSVDTIHNVIRRWRWFYYHLSRPGPNDFPNIRMEMHYLTEERMDTYVPIGENLIAQEPAYVDVQVDMDCYLGVTLYNDGDVPLYPYLFYFDPNDLTIDAWTIPSSGVGAGKYSRDGLDCPLPPHSTLPLGHGNGGAPWQFVLPDGKKRDVGYLKLFLTASPANFSHLVREGSAFESGQARQRHGPSKVDSGQMDNSAFNWGSKTVTIVQLFRERSEHTG